MVDKTAKGTKSAKWKMGNHYEMKHKELLPPDMDGYRWFYYLLTKKSKGSCVMCKNETEFNRTTMKYARFCDNPQCKQRYREQRDRRMIAKYGKAYLTDDPDQQKKMQAGRKIGGIYNWSDGHSKFPYLSSYELDFLKYLDLELKWPASDLVAPSPHTYTYKYHDEDHFYMPDFYIPTENLEIEIKSAARMENQNQESREKEVEKIKLMQSCSNMVNFIIIFDKKYDEFNRLIITDDN
jgi:hypothetical protein